MVTGITILSSAKFLREQPGSFPKSGTEGRGIPARGNGSELESVNGKRTALNAGSYNLVV